jgi:cyclophilin family peptidyl-prolyl cis-trans isomerase
MSVAFAAALAACSSSSKNPPTASSSAAPSLPLASHAPIPSSILAAEQRRAPSEIHPDDQASRDVSVRRAAARALARIASPGARVGLLHALADEDPIVVAWAAYGLGASCEVARADTVSALAARALALPAEPEDQRPSALVEIARAIGRCGADTSEAALFAWLSRSPREARAASLGLGDLTRDKRKLVDATIASLLNLAAGTPSTPSVPEAMLALANVDRVPETVVSRLLDVATERLSQPGDYRLFVVRSLSRAGKGAVAPLARVLADASFTLEEQVEAVRALDRLGEDGLPAINAALAKVDPDAAKIAAGGAPFDVTHEMLETVDDPKLAKDILPKLAALAAPDGVSASGKRRVSMIRCGAAKILAGTNVADPTLAACDLTDGTIGARALVEVIDKDEIAGPRLVAFTKLASSKDARTREAALELLEKHDEVAGAAALLAQALGAPETGVAGTAADVIVKAPDRASDAPKKHKPSKPEKKEKHKRKPDKKEDEKKKDKDDPPREPSKALLTALADAFDRADKAVDPELESSIIDAVGALGRKDMLPRLEDLCTSTYPTLRLHAAGALALITGKKRTCPSPEVAGPDPPELASAAPKAVTLVLETDAGELKIALDPELAPITTARIVDVAKSGYYDGTVIHRVDPSFVVQFGSPHADGAGGPDGRMPLRCETSPMPFEKLSVGVALSGRDTGSSQLFVMRSRMPHLDGLYPIVGTASGDWEVVSEGDVIKSVRVE